MSRRKLVDGAPTARRREPDAVRGLPSWVRAITYDSDMRRIVMHTVAMMAHVRVDVGPAGTPTAYGDRLAPITFMLSPHEARAVIQALERCVDAESAVVLDINT